MSIKPIDKRSEEPLYLQLFEMLKKKIESSMKENDKLDSERDICNHYNVSRTTVRQALDKLEKEGYIEKVHGKGNFVTQPLINQDLVRFYSFSEEMRKLGKTPSSIMPSFELVEISEKISQYLQMEPGELAYRFIRIRFADEVPMMYETTYLPCDRFKNMTREMLKHRSMYDIFGKVYGIKISGAEETLVPIIVNRLESLYLDYPEGGPGLKIMRVTREGSRIVEYTESIARGDKFKYRVYLENES